MNIYTYRLNSDYEKKQHLNRCWS